MGRASGPARPGNRSHATWGVGEREAGRFLVAVSGFLGQGWSDYFEAVAGSHNVPLGDLDVHGLAVRTRDASFAGGDADPDCARAWSGLVNRRADSMLQLARDLRRTGQLRADLDDQQVADIIWATNSAEYFLLLVHRGWTTEQFGTHLVDLWTRTLLDPSAALASALDAER